MKTDALFYELFRIDPRSLFELIQIKVEGDYVFESITVKNTEKRFDGFFRRTDGIGPNGFLEVQGYEDKAIYWRFFREIYTWYEQNENRTSFLAVILFLDEKFDPGDCMLSCVPPCRFVRVCLPDCLNALGDRAGALTVLKPLIVSDQKELIRNARKWKEDIQSPDFSNEQTKALLELLEYAIIQRFPNIDLKEIQKMIELTPLEKTAAGKELIEIGIEKGIEKGRLIGEIRTTQRFLKLQVTPEDILLGKSVEELLAILEKIGVVV